MVRRLVPLHERYLATSGFDPSEVYESLYEMVCLDAISSFSSEGDYVFDLNDYIKHHFTGFARRVLDKNCVSSHVRRDYLRESHLLWRSLQTNRTCLLCLCRAPEHVLSCGHSTCDACLKIFGIETSIYEYRFEIPSCLLCVDRGSVIGKTLPPTSGVRALTIDGGGICGVIPLEFLRLLQRILGPTIPIQDLFDVVFGTSSGKHSPEILRTSLLICLLRWLDGLRTLPPELEHQDLRPEVY